MALIGKSFALPAASRFAFGAPDHWGLRGQIGSWADRSKAYLPSVLAMRKAAISVLQFVLFYAEHPRQHPLLYSRPSQHQSETVTQQPCRLKLRANGTPQ